MVCNCTWVCCEDEEFEGTLQNSDVDMGYIYIYCILIIYTYNMTYNIDVKVRKWINRYMMGT